ncbi:ABC transporter ATP-binding protein [Polaromonas sp.]|jgi:branched-chain amino acid transport system ATP-binding protein|uniref:ABC transporter ATP-binding protein n=1 Tax=Polaromonas sp. TaxID=1869339 RepID=UPI002488901E|nr:ABC transporter ATP-binding protein [Polaromonas sp.]MDI1339616.1 ABC transporter ATP-binding protein [Polaromonas sp.]
MSTHLDVAALATGRSVNDIVRVQGLHKHFGGPAVLEDVSFSLCAGQVHSVIGPNGAGKTTLLNVLSGLYQPSAGEVFIAGRSLARLPPHHLAKLGVARTFQNLKIARNLTIEENVLLGAHARARAGIWAGIFRPPELVRRDSDLSVRARELLQMVGVEVDPQTMPDALSYGALKRLEIARALMAEPRLLLLDEPAAGLNQRETVEIGQLIKRLTEHNITVVLIEHDMKLVMGISDQVIVLNYGRKIAQGTPDFVVRDPEVVKAYLGTNH